MRKKVKLEVTDEDGTKYSLSVHGRFSQEKVLRMMEVVDMLGGGHGSEALPHLDESSAYGAILHMIESSYSTKEFSSADIARDYEEQHGEPIPLSTVSTYLSRLTERGNLKRQKFGNSWVYRLSHLSPDQLTR